MTECIKKDQSQSHINLLDHGFLQLVDSMGDDLTIVNSARVSFGKRKTLFEPADEKLIKYLATHSHTSPFRHAMLTFHVKAPEFVSRQWYKHVVGIETTSSSATKDHAWNEISGRYVPINEFYCPKVFRAQSNSSKQGSEGEIKEQEKATLLYNQSLEIIKNTYQELLKLGVSKELSRCILPISFYTEFYWTCSLQAACHFIELRKDKHAQEEIRVYAEEMEKIIREKFPVSAKYLLE